MMGLIACQGCGAKLKPESLGRHNDRMHPPRESVQYRTAARATAPRPASPPAVPAQRPPRARGPPRVPASARPSPAMWQDLTNRMVRLTVAQLAGGPPDEMPKPPDEVARYLRFAAEELAQRSFVESILAGAPGSSPRGLALRGGMLLLEGKAEEALELFRAAEVGLRGDPAPLWMSMAKAHAILGRDAEAERRLRRVLARGPHADATLALADVLTWQQRGAEACDVLREGCAAQPEALELRLAFGSALLERGRASEAEAELLVAWGQRRDGLAAEMVARAVEAQGREEEALDWWRRAVEAGPEDDERAIGAAARFADRGRFAEALRFLEGRGGPEPGLARAAVLAKADRVDEAEAEMARLRRERPEAYAMRFVPLLREWPELRPGLAALVEAWLQAPALNEDTRFSLLAERSVQRALAHPGEPLQLPEEVLAGKDPHERDLLEGCFLAGAERYAQAIERLQAAGPGTRAAALLRQLAERLREEELPELASRALDAAKRVEGAAPEAAAPQVA